MKKHLTLVSLLFLSMQIFAETPTNSFFIDFGPNDVSNGNSTIGPDANDNYWNNATIAKTTAPSLALVNSANVASTAFMTVTADFLGTNGIVNGGLLDPSADLLDEFAINTATQDFFYTDANVGGLSFGGLNPTSQYIFRIFASRVNTENRTSQYTIVGNNTYVGTLQSSGIDLGGTGVNANNSTILVTTAVTPTSGGIITMAIGKTAGTYAFINCLKMEEYAGVNGIEDNASDSQVSVYPNPTSDFINIKIGEDANWAIVKLFSSDGKLLYSKRTVNKTEQLDIKKLNVSGLTIVNVTTANSTERFKIVIK